MTRTTRHLIWAAVAGLVLAGLTAAPAQASTPTNHWECRQYDTTISLSPYNEEHTPTLDSTSDGVEVQAKLCRDHNTSGWYFAVETRDTAEPGNNDDGKCAHAGLHWRKANGTEDIDYGMWKCAGSPADFYTPIRNQTRYEYVYVTSFVDGGPEYSSYWQWVPDLL